MSTEVRPLGVRCNILCQYCYQNPLRDAGAFSRKYNLDAMKAAVVEAGGPFTLFGGEPLLVPERDLEELWRWGYERYGANGVQTNGSLINKNHIRLFKLYNVCVGISIDGPGELNDARWAGSLKATREATRRTEAAIELLSRRGIPPTIIVTLHRHNAAPGKLARMDEWIRQLHLKGIFRMRLHLLEADSPETQERLALPPDENIHALLHFARLENQLPGLRFDLFEDMRGMLLGNDEGAGCVWHACDPYTTHAVQGVEGSGQRSNCGRTNKDGIDFVESDKAGFERQIALYGTPQEQNGCQGCRFFLMCKGNCPGTAVGGDWRNRSEHCAVWMALYEHFEEELISHGKEPLSRSPLRDQVERTLLQTWRTGRDRSIAGVLQELRSAAKESPKTRPVNGSPGCSPKASMPKGFGLPPCYRLSWVSDEARRVWQPRFERVRKALREVEVFSVLRGVRKAAIVHVAQDELADLLEVCQRCGLAATLLTVRVRDFSSPWACATPCPSGIPLEYEVGIASPGGERTLQATHDNGDARRLGELSGYPQCCLRSYQRNLAGRSAADPVWVAARGDAGRDEGICQVEGPREANFLLRAIGLCAIAHVPCSFRCGASARLGKRYIDASRDLGRGREMDWLEKALDWPVEWSALHGIAEIKLPIAKISLEAGGTAAACIVRRPGTSFPTEGERGLRFPFQAPSRPKLTDSRRFKDGFTVLHSQRADSME